MSDATLDKICAAMFLLTGTSLHLNPASFKLLLFIQIFIVFLKSTQNQLNSKSFQ